jgi:WD40 repeat protein
LRTISSCGNVAFAPDSSWLVSTDEKGNRLKFWDVATGRLLQTFPAHKESLLGLAVHPGGARIATSGRDKVRILDRATGREMASWATGSDWEEKYALAYSPDGRRLAGTGDSRAGADDGLAVIDVVDARTYHRTARLVGHTSRIHAIAFSPDGLRLASTGLDRTVRLWDVATGECQAVLRGHTDQVFALAFHPDGKRLASGGRDRAIWIWDVTTGQEVARLPGHANYVFSLAFSPDGKSLVSGSGDGTVRLWDTTPLAARYQARAQAEARRPRAEELVERLFTEHKGAAAVAAALRADATLDESLRHAAFRALQRRPTP